MPFAARVEGDASYYLVHRKGDGSRRAVRDFVDWIEHEMAAFGRAILRHPRRRQMLAGRPMEKTR